ncbi:MAG: hypothetical protein DRP83_10030 [Planctomycetota bacterium]|nr:MAG: hypothetical protein DRP83_10030 [Planctomycetota bacterium]
MIDRKDITNPDEKIVRVSTTIDKKTETFYMIWDRNLNYWRSNSPLGEYDAWTRDIARRATFETLKRAKRELSYIAQWRSETP